MRLMNPVSHVENHPRCRTNADGEPLLPNDLPWRQQLAMYLVSSKLLIDTEEVLQVKQDAPATRAQCASYLSANPLLTCYTPHDRPQQPIIGTCKVLRVCIICRLCLVGADLHGLWLQAKSHECHQSRMVEHSGSHRLYFGSLRCCVRAPAGSQSVRDGAHGQCMPGSPF